MTFYHTNNSIKIPESGNYNTRFSQYITGLLEGDGTIHVPKTLRSVKGTLNYPSIQIVFHLKDLPSGSTLCRMRPWAMNFHVLN